MAHAKKMKKKNKVQPCTDANQHVREHALRVAKRNAYELKQREKALEEYRKLLEANRPKVEVVNPAQLEKVDVEADVVNA